MQRKAWGIAFAVLVVPLFGCSALPGSGPDMQAVAAQTRQQIRSPAGAAGIEYALVDIDARVLGVAAPVTPLAFVAAPGVARGGPPTPVLGVGDVVRVSVFESQAGGLFIPAEAGARPGNFINLPAQTIDRDGAIGVPYAGKVRALGRTAEAVQSDIAARLADRAIEPQVVVSIEKTRSMQASVLGAVHQPQKVELSPAGERLLDVVSAAGGLSGPERETTITLQRRGRSLVTRYDMLTADPSKNIYVLPGDTVLVNRNRRTFLAFGAAGQNGRIDFGETDLTLGEALAKAGGLLDARAEPRAVLLYRRIDAGTARRLGLDPARFGGDMPVIFRSDLRDPAGFFAAQSFAMQDKDILYVSNAPTAELAKFLTLLRGVTAPARDIADTRRWIGD
ncbi:MAG: polysaccharide export protein [Rhizobiales bacterium]|nr:polysaccharide export protein [Hyphomicrobiales bacterium]